MMNIIQRVLQLTIKMVVSIIALVIVDCGCRASFPARQFSYNYRTGIAFNHEKEFELSPTILAKAKEQNKYLNDSIHFDRKFIKDIKEVRKLHVNPEEYFRQLQLKNQKNPIESVYYYELTDKKLQKDAGELISNIVTEDHVQLFTTYFNRGSDKLLIVGEGFTNERELVTPYVALFPDYDIVLFDFRGQGFRDFDYLDPETWKMNFAQVAFGMDSGLATLGKKEELDVFAVVDYFKKLKQEREGKAYSSVYGVSLCYSSFIFLKAQAVREREQLPLFDKIIADGAWLNVPLVVEKLKKDPKMICNPQHGGWAESWPFNREWMQEGIIVASNLLTGLPVDSDVNILDYVGDIKSIPVLFFHAKNDLMVYQTEFEMLWSHVGSKEKAAVVTEYAHVRNHLNGKEEYKWIADAFFQNSFEDFKSCLSRSRELLNDKDDDDKKIAVGA